MDIDVLWIPVVNYPCFYGYPFGYPWISMDIYALTCYGSSIQGYYVKRVVARSSLPIGPPSCCNNIFPHKKSYVENIGVPPKRGKVRRFFGEVNVYSKCYLMQQVVIVQLTMYSVGPIVQKGLSSQCFYQRVRIWTI